MNSSLKSIREEFDKIENSSGWELEFKRLSQVSNTSLQRRSSVVALLPENETRNRYCNVYPFDDTRVPLQRIPNDYINASFVSIRSAKQTYILTQGPLANTVSHFWTMVWEQDVSVIVMLNRLVEKNVVKCERYWPSHSELFLNMQDTHLQVTLVKETTKGDFTKRVFELIDKVTKEKRTVVQLHFLSWPDFGTPLDPSSFLKFVEKVRHLRSKARGSNVIVHCSAGVGRSGTFCLVDACLTILQNKPPSLEAVSLRTLLLEMRDQRMGLIQTPDQLRFTYIAVMEGAKTMLLHRDDSFREDSHSSRNPSEPSTPIPRKRKSFESDPGVESHKRNKLADKYHSTESIIHSVPPTKAVVLPATKLGTTHQ